MKERRSDDDEAVSIQVGFVLNTGLLTTFIAIVLVVISGGFGGDVSTQDELEAVADSIEANMVEADRISVTSDSFTAFFEPPSSDIQYQAYIDSGKLYLTAPGYVGNLTYQDDYTRDLDENTLPDTDLNADGIRFGQSAENIILEYDGTGSNDVINVSVQRDVAGG